MPTSSQALIILAVDGRLPKKTPRRTFPVTSVPYPLRDYNMMDTCMTLENCSEDDVDDVIKILKSGERLQYPAESESLSDLLQITGYKGSLTFDPASRLLRWQINTELPPSSRNDFGQNFENRIKFPKISGRNNKIDSQFSSNEFSPPGEEAVNRPYYFSQLKNPLKTKNPYNAVDCDHELYDSNFELPKKSKGYPNYAIPRSFLGPDNFVKTPQNRGLFSARESLLETMDTVSQESDDKMKRTLSLPSLFKARINKDLYRKLCSLGFRKPKEMEEENRKGTPNIRREATSDLTPKQAWENETEGVDYSKDKDFRLEDLSLQTGSLDDVIDHSRATELAHRFPNNKEYQNYIKERNIFFGKYDNYEPYASTSYLNTNQQTMETSSNALPHIQRPEYRYRNEDCEENDQVDDVNDARKEQKKTLLEEVKLSSNYNKWKKRRLTSVRMRKEMPPSDPLCVCFNLPDNAMSHEEVKALVEDTCGGRVSEIQFDPINVVAVDSDSPSRWIARMRDMKSRDRILQTGVVVDGERREVKLLDVVHQEEVDAYKFYELVQRGKLQIPGNIPKRKKSKVR